MIPDPQDQVATMCPVFLYHDADAALAWLAAAFGFDKTLEVLDPDGRVQHAELRYGGSTTMLGTATEAQLATRPPESSPVQGIYVVVPDVDAHHARAEAAGAEITLPPEDTEFGSRRYQARDLEGYEWNFGTYRPGDVGG